MKSKNLLTTIGIIAAAVAFVGWVPLPYNVKCATEIKPSQAFVQRVIAKTGGRLEAVDVELGQEVAEGDVIARLVDPSLDLELQEYTRQVSSLRQQWDAMMKNRQSKPLASEVQVVRQRIDTLEKVIANKTLQKSWLTLTAPISGVVLPPNEKKPDPKVEGRLPGWDGSLLRKENNGAVVQMDDVVCFVGDPHKFEAMLIIDQADLPFVSEEMDATLLLDAYTSVPFDGKITDIAGVDMEVSPASMSNQVGGQLPTVTDAAGVPRPQSASYEARVPLDELPVNLRAGMRGRAKIKAKPQTIAQRGLRLLARTFHFNI